MALDTTVSGTAADSYIDASTADDLLAWRNSSAWSNATTDDKEAVLRAAVTIMDGLLYQDQKADLDQALRFPTTGMQEDNAYYVSDRVKRAQAYLALALLENPDLVSGLSGVKQVSVPGAFSVTMGEGTDLGDDVALPPLVRHELSPYFARWGNVPRTWDSAGRRFY